MTLHCLAKLNCSCFASEQQTELQTEKRTNMFLSHYLSNFAYSDKKLVHVVLNIIAQGGINVFNLT